ALTPGLQVGPQGGSIEFGMAHPKILSKWSQRAEAPQRAVDSLRWHDPVQVQRVFSQSTFPSTPLAGARAMPGVCRLSPERELGSDSNQSTATKSSANRAAIAAGIPCGG